MSTNWPEGVDRKVYASLDSTNSEAARIAASLSGPTWLLALDQTAARGRRGREWVFPKGNFAASLVFRPSGPLETWAQRSFVAALALGDTLVDLTGRVDGIALKWPNDVLLNGGKLAGILLESSATHLTIGIGVNLVAAPTRSQLEPHAVPPVSLAGETGVTTSPEAFLTPLAAHYARYEEQLSTYGFAPIRSAWLARAARLNQPIRAVTGSTTHHGTFRDIDASGNLVLQTASGTLAIPAAEVHF